MGKLAEVERAVDELSPDEQRELLRFLATRLGGPVSLQPVPEPRDIPLDQIQQWIAEDEAGMRRFLEGS